MDYTIPFGLVVSVAPAGAEDPGAPRASVTLHSGEALQLERAGDLGAGHAGMLVFVDNHSGHTGNKRAGSLRPLCACRDEIGLCGSALSPPTRANARKAKR